MVTQPDRPAGRGQKLVPTPVKAAALARGLSVYEPLKLKPFAETLRGLAPDVFVVASYGRILPQAVLDLPAGGIAFNVHPSLLPLYRGATPLQSAIREGCTETGVTIIAMDAGMDTGDVLLQERTPLGATETYGELHDRLARLGAQLLGEALDRYAAGTLERRRQIAQSSDENFALATLTRPLNKDDMLIDWSWPAVRIINLVRSLAPAPAARATLEGDALKVLAVRAAEGSETGTTGDDGYVVRAGDGAGVVLLRVVPPNRSAMSGAAYARAAAAV
ncbi:MAG: methionyl-tRNA formyltransferase [Candidatus Velthaea sp.]